jgi:hypothetical protein
MTISAQLIALRDSVKNWASLHGGSVTISSSPPQFDELAFNRPGSVCCAWSFVEEIPHGDTPEIRVVRRTYRLTVMTTQSFGILPEDELVETGQSGAPLFDMLEEIREIVCWTQFQDNAPEEYVEYIGSRPADIDEANFIGFELDFTSINFLPLRNAETTE